MEEEKKTGNWKSSSYFRTGRMIFLTVAACIMFFFLIFRLDLILGVIGKILVSGQAILFGFAIAYILNPIMKKVERLAHRVLDKRMKKSRKCKKVCRAIGVIGAILFFLIIMGLLVAAVVPAFIDSAMHLAKTLPGYVENFINNLEKGDLIKNSPFLKDFESYLKDATAYSKKWATTSLLPELQNYLPQLTGGVLSVFKGILNFLIGIIAAVYVMSMQESLMGQSKKIVYAVFKPKRGNQILELTREVNRIFGGFISGKIVDSAIIGVICYIGCLILRIPDAILVSVIVGVFNIIPFFGPIIGAVPSVFIVLVQSPIHALYLTIFIIILQQVDGNIIGPKILGDSTGLSSFWVLFSILIFGGMFGFLGMLFGVPVFAVIYYLVRQWVNYRVAKKNLSENTVEYIHVLSVDETNNKFVYSQGEEKEDKNEDVEE